MNTYTQTYALGIAVRWQHFTTILMYICTYMYYTCECARITYACTYICSICTYTQTQTTHTRAYVCIQMHIHTPTYVHMYECAYMSTKSYTYSTQPHTNDDLHSSHDHVYLCLPVPSPVDTDALDPLVRVLLHLVLYLQC